ncbi:unnamed protein product [Polarella glacialis]|uniref:Uncharacterized protein n=1 Tax=Polarella glacialis TaxID=89957 RepID=A0A813FTQ5_POLGL|nr:unnamed protein product [Polarella glacialis]
MAYSAEPSMQSPALTDGQAAACTELAAKLAAGGLAEVRDRALRALSSKVEGGLVSPEVALGTVGLPQLVLHWLNDRQDGAPPALLCQAVRLLGALASSSPQGARKLKEAGCGTFLEDFRPQAPSQCWPDLDAVLLVLRGGTADFAAELSQRNPLAAPIAASSRALQQQPPLVLTAAPTATASNSWVVQQTSLLENVIWPQQFQERPPQPLSQQRVHPQRQPLEHQLQLPPQHQEQSHPQPQHQMLLQAREEPAASQFPQPETLPALLSEVDAQVLMDLSVRLKFGDEPSRLTACGELRTLVADLPPLQLLAHSPLVEGLCHTLGGGSCGSTATGPPRARSFVSDSAAAGHAGGSGAVAAATFICSLLKRLAQDHVPDRSYQSSRPRRPLPIQAAQALWRLLEELLRGGLQRGPIVALQRAALAVLHFCRSDRCSGAAPMPGPAAPQLRACLTLASESLAQQWASSQKSLRSLEEALGWFRCLLPGFPGELQPEERQVWQEPLCSHDWTPSLLLTADVMLSLLEVLVARAGAEGAAAFAKQDSNLASLVLDLLFDYRFLFERPGWAKVLLVFARGVAPAKAKEFELFRELTAAACRGDHLQVAWMTAGALESDTSALGRLLARIPRLEHSMRLLAVGDAALHPRSLVPQVLGLVAELADLGHGSLASCRGDARSSQGDEHPAQHQQLVWKRLRDSCATLCCRMASCPDSAVCEVFFRALEAEPLAAWIYWRPDFVVACLSSSGRASQSVVRWRQGDCAASSDARGACLEEHDENNDKQNLELERATQLIEFVEAACPEELAPSSLAATLRRLFAAGRASREEAALLIWRGEAMARDGCQLQAFIRFHTDPVGAVSEEEKKQPGTYAVAGLRSSCKDVGQLLDLLGNTRLGWGPRASALAQLATLAASDTAQTLGHLRTADEAGQRADTLMLQGLRQATAAGMAVQAAGGEELEQQERQGRDEFLVRLCHAAVLILLADAAAGRSQATAASVVQRFRGHRNVFLDRLLPLVFHSSPRLRAAALQLMAGFLFDPALTFLGGATAEHDSALPSAGEAGRSLGLMPAWLARSYLLPLPMQQPTSLVAPATPAACFWKEMTANACRAVALCQVFHRLHARLGFGSGWVRFLALPADAAVAPHGAPRQTGPRSPSAVWRWAEELLASTAHSPQQLPDAAGPLLLQTSPHGAGPLFSAGYLALLTSGLSPAAWLPQARHAQHGRPLASPFQPPDEAQLRMLEHALQLVECLSPVMAEGSENKSYRRTPWFSDCEDQQQEQLQLQRQREALQQLAELLRERLLPATWGLLATGTAGMVAGYGDTSDTESRVPLSEAIRHAHGLLAAEPRASQLAELLLRLAIALAQQPDLSNCWLQTKDWVPLLSAVSTCNVPGLPRLALGLTVLLPPSPPAVRATSCGSGLLAGDSNEHLGEALFECLSGSRACAGSRRHSAELKAALWLSAGHCPAEVAAYVTPWLTHSDVAVSAVAWRSLRCLLFERQPEEGEVPESRCAERAAASSRALRALRAIGPGMRGAVVSKEGRTEEAGEMQRQRRDDEESDEDSEIQRAEALELLRWAVEAVVESDALAASDEARQSEVYVRQVLESGLLAPGGTLSLCLSSKSHLGLRRAALRLLSALLLADSAAASSALLRGGIWPLVVEAGGPIGQLLMGEGCAAGQLLDGAALAADMAALVVQGAASDLQLLLWLAVSSPLLDTWRTALQGLAGVAGASTESGRAVSGQSAEEQQRLATLLCTHVNCLFRVMAMLRVVLEDGMAGAGGGKGSAIRSGLHPGADDGLPGPWAPVAAFLCSPAVNTLLAESLAEWLPAATRRAAAAALASHCGLRLLGLASPTGFPAAGDEVLASRACGHFLSETALGIASVAATSGNARPAGLGVSPGSNTAGGSSSSSMAEFMCLTNLFRASPAAARAAWRAGFGQALCSLLGQLSLPEVPSDGMQGKKKHHPQQRQKLTWTLRVFTALLCTSSEAREASIVSSSAVGPTGEDAAPAGLLASVLLSVRPLADRDEEVCLELLECLGRLASAEGAKKGLGDLAGLLLRIELVPWMMRLSLRRRLTSASYCRLLATLSLCGPALSGSQGKQLLLRYLGQVLQMVRALSKSHGGPWPQMSDDWRYRRLVATLNFVASLRLCARSAALLAGGGVTDPRSCSGTSAASTAGGPAGGLDLWLDLAEPPQAVRGGGLPLVVRCASLRVLLAIATSSSPHAKAYFVSSGRAVPLLVRLLQSELTPLAALAMNVLWVLAHNNQRALPLLRRHGLTQEVVRSRAPRAAHEAITLSSLEALGGKPGHDEGYLAIMAGQLDIILR